MCCKLIVRSACADTKQTPNYPPSHILNRIERRRDFFV